MPAYNIHPDYLVDVTSFKIKFKDIFHLSDLYKAVHDWLLEYDWSSTDSQKKPGKGDEREGFEVLYNEINMGGVKEIWALWRLQKLPYKNNYLKWHLDMQYHTLGITDTEIVVKRQKFKVQKGEVEMQIKVMIELDYNHEWRNSPFLKNFHNLLIS